MSNLQYTTYREFIDLQDMSGSNSIALPTTEGAMYYSSGSQHLLAPVSMHSHKITDVVDPTADQDAATKKYVDDSIDSGNNLSVEADSGGLLSVDLADDDFNILGTSNEIEIAGAKAGTEVTFTVGLPDDVTIGNNLIVTDTAGITGDLGVSGSTTLGNAAADIVTITGQLTASQGASFGDSKIYNVSDIALDSISADDGSSFSMGSNWTNASRTVADMGTVTTMDLNGGSIDGTVIGAAAVAAGSFAAVVGTTATFSSTLAANGDTDLGNATSDTITATGRFDSDLVPSSDSARDLGTSALQWAEAHIDTGHIDTVTATNVDGILGANTAAAATVTTLTLTAMGGNWTNASRTVADMGTVTTMDLNGGSIDGTVIGAASAAAGTFAAIVGTTVSGTVGSLTSLKVNGNIGPAEDTDLLSLESGQLDVNGILSGSGAFKAGGNLTVGPDAYGLTTAGALDIASMAANWTNASRTVADMGTVTTMDLNGGSIDGTVIGGATPAAADFTTLDASGNVTFDANVTLGNADTDVITLTGQVTASANFLFTSAGEEKPVVTIKTTHAGAEGAILRFNKDSASPAANDYLGMIEFYGDDSAGNETEFAIIEGQCLDPANGSEDGAVIVECMVGGSLVEVAQFWDGTNGLVLPNQSTYGSVKAHSFVSYSDESLKKNIQPIANPMDKLMLLQGVTYDWKQDGTNDIGFIAQEVEKVIPEVVYSAEGKDGSYGLDYASLTALLTEAIKFQQSEIQALKNRLDMRVN